MIEGCPARPSGQAAILEYVEWAVPRARLLGVRLTKPDQRSIGAMHVAWRLKAALAKDMLAAQKAQALEAPTAGIADERQLEFGTPGG